MTNILPFPIRPNVDPPHHSHPILEFTDEENRRIAECLERLRFNMRILRDEMVTKKKEVDEIQKNLEVKLQSLI